jgi:hypothetical protein
MAGSLRWLAPPCSCTPPPTDADAGPSQTLTPEPEGPLQDEAFFQSPYIKSNTRNFRTLAIFQSIIWHPSEKVNFFTSMVFGDQVIGQWMLTRAM